jgi:uncharacterized membrane protein HdeD (DUF308 family)
MTLVAQKSPTWVRIIQFVTGGIAIALSGYVLANPIPTTWFLLTFLGISLLVVGISSIITGVSRRSDSKSTRTINIGIGIAAIIGGFITFTHPIAALASLLWFISIFVFIYAAGLVASGFARHDLGRGARIARVIIGVIVLILSGLLIEYPGFALTMMIMLLSINLLIQGIERIISGAVGYRMVKRV